MNTLQESDWIKTTGYPGVTLGFNHLASAGPRVLVSTEEKSGDKPYYRYSLCNGLANWIPINDPIYDGKCTSLSSDGTLIIASAITETVYATKKDYKFNVTTSYNGSVWSMVHKYSIDDTTVDLSYVTSRYLVDTHFFLYTGFFFYSIRDEWVCVPLKSQFSNARILDVSYFNNNFIFLLYENERYYLLYTADLISFKDIQLVWPGISIKSLYSNNSQLIALGSETNNNKCVIMYTHVGITNEWQKISFTPLGLEEGHSGSLYDAIFYRGSWYIVGSTTEIKNKRTFTVKSLTYKIVGDIHVSNPILMETNPASNLKKIYLDQHTNTLYAIGEARPTGDYFILYKRFTNDN